MTFFDLEPEEREDEDFRVALEEERLELERDTLFFEVLPLEDLSCEDDLFTELLDDFPEDLEEEDVLSPVIYL